MITVTIALKKIHCSANWTTHFYHYSSAVHG